MFRTTITKIRNHRLAMALCLALLLATPAVAQFTGHNILGDFGLKSGSQPPIGFYAGYMYYKYDTNTLVGAGNVTLPGSGSRNLTVMAHGLLTSWVTPKKVLGANIGGVVVFPWLNGSINAPQLDATGSFGYSDTYVQPVNLGWKTKHADILSAYAFFAPTGKYEPGALDNRGKGFWSHELTLGTTVYLDEAKTWSVATTGFYEMHTTRKGGDVKVGDILTLEGGFAKTLKRIINVGPAYYAQWKVTSDSGPGVPALFKSNKHRVFGVGPEISVFLPTKMSGQHVESGVNASVRYLWETGAVMKTQGNSLIIALAYLF